MIWHIHVCGGVFWCIVLLLPLYVISDVAILVAAETADGDVAGVVYLLDDDLMIRMPDGLSDIYSHNVLWCHTCSM